MRHLSFVLLLVCLPVLAATVWKWRDAEGVIHYSDQPVPGAEQVSAQPSNTFSAPATSAASSATSPGARAAAATTGRYATVAITAPANEDTIAGTGGVVAVSARIEPQLAPQHQLALYLDGKRVEGYPPQALSYSLSDVPRGEHSLTLVVLDARGTTLASSASVTFFVQQPSVLMRH